MARRKKVEINQETSVEEKREQVRQKQEETLARMKQTRHIDSDNLREVIKAKLTWVELELKKGEAHQKGLEGQLDKLKHQISQLKGIKLFIEDLLMPSAQIEEKEEPKQ